MKTLIERIHAIESPEDMAAIEAEIRALPGKMPADVQQALLDRLKRSTRETRQMLSEEE